MKSLTLFTLVLSTTLTACGGSSGEQVAGIDARGNPQPTAVVSRGTIAGFGSIIVNGVRYDTTNATIDADGSPGTQANLKVGQVVTVRGSLNDDSQTGVANSVTFADLVEGPISAIDAIAGTITVLGQLVIVDADTSFDDSISPASIDGLAVNDIVEVSGFFFANGSISATRIEDKPAGSEFEVTGQISNLTATTFQLNSLVVDYSGAQIDDFPGGSPQEGQLVEAKGTTFGGAGELMATRVEFKGNDLSADDGDQVEVEGFITRFVSATDFDVEGIPVTTTGATTYLNGTSADLAINRKVEVEGVIDANGRITASKIEIKLSNFIRIEGMVESLGAASVSIFGIEINVNNLTRYEDKSSADLETFGLADINVGDYLETRGYEDASGVVATRLEREDFDGEVAIRAFVDSVSEPNLTIRGVMIETNGGTVFRDVNDSPISATEFFAQAMGSLAEAVGTPSNGGIIADEVELED